MPQVRPNFSPIYKINDLPYNSRKTQTNKQNNNSLSTTQKTIIGATALTAIVIGGLLLHKHISKNIIKSDVFSISTEDITKIKQENISNKPKRILFENSKQADRKVQEVISNSPKLQGGKHIKEGQQNIIFNNINIENVVSGKSNLDGVAEKMITPQEHSAYARKVRFKRPSIKEQKLIRALNEENAQRRTELNTLGNSKDGNVLAQLLEKLS